MPIQSKALGYLIMSTIETIVEDLRYLPKEHFDAAAEVIHKIREDYLTERNRIVDETAGCMSKEQADVFREALQESRRTDVN